MDLQTLCDDGQRRLMETDYLAAERLLVEAERQAWESRDWDTLSRLYMPLQEARRQRRQRCGEGVIRLDLCAAGPQDLIDPIKVLDQYQHGQLLVAGWASLEPARQVRLLAAERGLYIETFLAAIYSAGDVNIVVIVPTEHVALPSDERRPIDQIIASLPPHSIAFPAAALPTGDRPGDDATYAETMSLWEQLHRPYLASAEASVDPVQRMSAYRRTIEVDYACEIAHQNLAKTAHQLLMKR